MIENDLYIFNGKRPWWQIIIAAAMITLAITGLYGYLFDHQLVRENKLIYLAAHPEITLLLLVIGTSFASVIDYKFDIKNKRYLQIYCLGFIKIPLGWNYFKNLNYVAVFQKKPSVYLVNLWYNKNRHFTITAFNDEKIALSSGISIAKSLSLDVWDATDKNNTHWV